MCNEPEKHQSWDPQEFDPVSHQKWGTQELDPVIVKEPASDPGAQRTARNRSIEKD